MVSYFNMPTVMNHLRPCTPIMSKPGLFPEFGEYSYKQTDQVNQLNHLGFHHTQGLNNHLTLKQLMKYNTIQTGVDDCLRKERLIPNILKHLLAKTLVCEKMGIMDNCDLNGKAKTQSDSQHNYCNSKAVTMEAPICGIEPQKSNQTQSGKTMETLENVHNCKKERTLTEPSKCNERPVTNPVDKNMVVTMEVTLFQSANSTQVLVQHSHSDINRNYHQMACTSEGGAKSVEDHVCKSDSNYSDMENINIKAETKSRDLTSVLFDRKKCSKKGRPSSKKQRKRQREKHKQSDKSTVDLDKHCSEQCQNGRIVSDPLETSSSNIDLSFGSLVASIFIVGSDEDVSDWSDVDDDENCSSDDWRNDAIFGSLSLNTNLVCFEANFTEHSPNPRVPDNEHMSVQDSPLSDVISLTPSSSWSVDSSLPADEVGGVHHVSSTEDHNEFCEDLKSVNARWRKDYAFSHPVTVDPPRHGKHRSKKVHFPEDTDLVTVHLLEPEDRRNPEWRRLMADKERFRRLVEACNHIISPVLCPDHRAEVFKRNQCLNNV